MLVEVEARTPQGSFLTMALADVSDGLIIEDIEGLGPVKATIVSSNSAKLDSSEFQSSRREDRNIKIKLGLDPDDGDVQGLRSMLYGYFMPKLPIILSFRHDNGLEVEVPGVVESCEPPLFTRDPQMDISIMCFPSDFVDTTPVVVAGTTVDTTAVVPIDYAGSVESGVLFTLNVNRAINEFTIYSTSADGVLRSMSFASPLQSGDTLKISTVPGDKYVRLTRNNSTSSRLYAVSTTSNWLKLQRGINNVRVYAQGNPIPWTMTYFTRYGGL